MKRKRDYPEWRVTKSMKQSTIPGVQGFDLRRGMAELEKRSVKSTPTEVYSWSESLSNKTEVSLNKYPSDTQVKPCRIEPLSAEEIHLVEALFLTYKKYKWHDPLVDGGECFFPLITYRESGWPPFIVKALWDRVGFSTGPARMGQLAQWLNASSISDVKRKLPEILLRKCIFRSNNVPKSNYGRSSIDPRAIYPQLLQPETVFRHSE